MNVIHHVLVYIGYSAAVLSLIVGVFPFYTYSLGAIHDDPTKTVETAIKAIMWALLLALVSSVLHRLI